MLMVQVDTSTACETIMATRPSFRTHGGTAESRRTRWRAASGAG